MKFFISFLTMAILGPSYGFASSPALDFELQDFGSLLAPAGANANVSASAQAVGGSACPHPRGCQQARRPASTREEHHGRGVELRLRCCFAKRCNWVDATHA